MKKSVIMGALVFTASILLPISVFASAKNSGTVSFDPSEIVLDAPEVMLDGITIDGISMDGKTLSEALAETEAKRQRVLSSKFTLSVEVGNEIKTLETTWESLGATYIDGEEVCKEAMALGKGRTGLITGFIAQRDIEASTLTFETKSVISEKTVFEVLYKDLKALNQSAVDADLDLIDNKFVVTNEIYGLNIDIGATIGRIVESQRENNLTFEPKIEVAAEVETPHILASDIDCIQDKLGECYTYISGPDNRVHNVQLGASRISGLILLPGESASVSDLMEKRDIEHGYLSAGQYVDGQTVEGVGGGVCQVSSTLYNALLEAEIQIDERHNHSMTVSYLECSKDAAIADGYKDLKFTNNQENAIFIYTWYNGRDFKFFVYGKETRPENRKVVYNSVITFEWDPKDKTVYDPNQPVGYKKTTGNHHKETKSYLEKIVYVDGVEESREIISKDYYLDSYKTTVIGTGGLSQEDFLNPTPIETVPLN